MPQRFPRGWALVLGLAMVAGLAYGVVPVDSVVTRLVLFNVPVGVAMVASWAAVHRLWHSRRGPWLALALAVTGFFAGEAIWWVYLALGQDPYPSLADAVFVLAYLPLGLTSVLLARGGGHDDRTAWLDAGVVAVIAGLGMWTFLVEPSTQAAQESMAARLFTLAYPIADLLTLVLALRLVLNGRVRTTATSIFATGVAATLLGDVSFSWMDLHGLYHSGSPVDTLWVLGYLTLAGAGLHPSAAEQPRRAAQESFGFARGRLAVVLASVLVPPIVMVVQFRHRHLLGVNTATVALLAAGGVMGLVSVRLWDLLGQTRRAESRRGEERLAALVHHSADAILLLDGELTVTFASPAARDVFDLDAADLTGRRFLPLISPDEREAMATQLRQVLDLEPDTAVPVTSHVAPGAGPGRVVEGTVRNLSGHSAIGALVVTLRDVTERRELEAQLERRAFHDDLTGLANRALFTDRVHHAIARHTRHATADIGVVFIDLDDFKAVNDGMGHGAGDRLLAEVGNRLRSCVRDADTVARLGGDEFALLLEDLPSPAEAMHLAERALEMLRMPLHVQGVDLAVPASAGVAIATAGCTVESLLRDADIAMYSAKAAGKAKVAMFDAALRDLAHRRLELKVELPEALRLGQFRLDYQPIQDLSRGQLRGFEALVRWHHPQRGVVSPAEFIPGAEESGLIVELGRWVLGEACRQAAEWNRVSGRRLTINVNVSAVQLAHPGLIGDVEDALARHGLAAELLTLEITESVLVQQSAMMEVLERLRAVGVGLAIDDFGTGYSSLAYLRRFPVTSVKIDRAFVSEVTQSGDAALVRSVVALARALSLTTVAEGVETAEQLEALDSLDCGLVQGYHVGRPAPPEQISAMLGVPGPGATAAAAAVAAVDGAPAQAVGDAPPPRP